MKTKIISIFFILILVGFNLTETCDAQWIKTNGPIGGSFRSFTAVGSTVFAGTSSGVVRSTDYGLSWAFTSLNLSVTDLASYGSNIYAGTSGGLKISTDYGITWSATSLTYSVTAVVANGPNVFAISSGLRRSTDYGQTWTLLSSVPAAYCLAIEGNAVYTGSSSTGVYRSLDNGNSWTHNVFNNEPIHAVAVKGNKVFATCESSFWGINYGIYGSTDYGDTWPIRALTNRDIWSLEAGDNYFFAGDQEDPTGVYRSSDGFTWTQTSLNNVNINPNSIFCIGSKVFTGTSSLECFVSNDNGGTWSVNSGILYNSSVYSLTASGTNIFAGTTYFLYQTSDIGQNWTQSSLNMMTTKSLAVSGSSILAGTSGHGIYISADNGRTWTQTSLNNRTINSLTVSGSNIFAGTSSYGIYFSSDNCQTWTQSSLNNRTINSLTVSSSNIFAGTSSYGVYRSNNNGQTWTQTALNNRTIFALAVSGTNILAGTSSYGVYLSNDNGQTWAQTSLNNQSVNAITVLGNYVLAGTLYGVYLSTDNGQIWNQAGINSYSINSILIKDNYIYAGTSGNAVWKRARTELIPFDAPVLLSPENNSICTTFTPVLNWKNVSGAAYYNLKVSTDSVFSSTVVDVTQLSDVNYTIPSGILQDSTSYFWKVSAEGGVWSDIWKFTVNIPITPEYTIEKIEILKGDILDMLDSNIISEDNYEMLVSKLNTAIRQIGHQHYNISINSIEQFIFEVNLLEEKNILSPEQAEPLRVQAYRIIAMLNILEKSETDNKMKITSEPEKTYQLNQNYPNPFNPVTTIKFSIAKESNVNLSIYDISGRMIKNIVNARLNAGSYEYVFNGANLASGIYFYRLETENFTDVKRMVLLK